MIKGKQEIVIYFGELDCGAFKGKTCFAIFNLLGSAGRAEPFNSHPETVRRPTMCEAAAVHAQPQTF